ncbi:hypothetical protein NIES806_11370 [Dolichospermum compactum NIES-806]|uniref:Carbonic anhydrase n=1 Tax=Dolichospermum compactum NIES-806 TaxID=1973481 RepID=A0A1Z4V0B4_9CYAN|nr:hypothetical protein NIES806_11370 [Dolichospermum compactum NIES-806]
MINKIVGGYYDLDTGKVSLVSSIGCGSRLSDR